VKPDRFARVKELVLKVADLPEPERRAALDDACKGDPELRREVEAILVHENETSDALKTHAVLERELGGPRPSARLIGQTIGHYAILELLGEGGMGEVYKAEDTRLKRPVALKFVRRDLFASDRLKARFIEEARAAAALDHPNICTVHAIEEWEGQLFLVMAYVDGKTLKERVARGPIDMGEALAIAIQAASGLAAAHAHGIVHRDIKSANIMLFSDGRAQIVDFGLARSSRRAEITETGAVVGTVGYMSPEQAQGKPLGQTTDIWSLAVVLYEMIAGRMPFRGGDERATIRSIINDEPERLCALRPDTPPELERIVCKAIAKDPDDRYASAAAFLDDLRALQRQIDLSSGAETIPIRLQIPRWQRRALIFAGAIVVVVSALFVREVVRRGETPAIPRGQSLQVTSSDAWDGEPAISPDGGRIAYASDESGISQINVIDVHGGNPLPLTSDSIPSYDPAWMPDGNSIVFVSDRNGSPGIWKTSQFGGGATLLLRGGLDPAISPDGTRIAFARPDSSGYLRICVASLDNLGATWVLTGEQDGLWDQRNPAWSPDGGLICYSAWQDLWLVFPIGGPARRLTKDGEADMHPSWSPEGRYVYFASTREGTQALWRVSASGGLPQRLTFGTGPEVHPSISRDGAKLAYSTERAGRELYLLDRGTRQEVRVPNVRNAFMASISPDGTRLAFAAQRWGDNYDLWLQSLKDGRPVGPPQRLLDQTGTVSNPTFSPDGRWIAYYLILHGERHVWVVSASGGEPIQFTNGKGAETNPAWSPDGKHLVFTVDMHGDSHIWVAPVSDGLRTGAPIEVPTGDEILALVPCWAPDGETIAFCGHRKDESDIWLVPADGSGPPRRVTYNASAQRVRWDPLTGDLLVSGYWGARHSFLYRVARDGGGSVRFEPEVNFGTLLGLFDLSSDGRLLVYSSQEDKGDVWVLEGAKGSY